MNATIKLEREKHFPVLLDELISIISPHYGGTFIDCTFGQGGYSKKILENKLNKVIAIDRDLDVKKKAKQFKSIFKDRFFFENKKFSEINILNYHDNNIKGIVFDLGYSSVQISDPKKGLSFNNKGELNMRMGFNDFSADEIINKLDAKSLEKIFKLFGEEVKSKSIAKKICYLRNEKKILTEDLVRIINSVKKNNNKKIHNATKVFQALRVFVNQEISELINGLINSFNITPIGGIIVVVTFHSIEDRIVKFFFKNFSEEINSSRYLPNTFNNNQLFKLIKKKPILPTKTEIMNNPSSRSAKLRYGIKISNKSDFSEFLNKFNYLLNTENLSNKLWKNF